jgi:hypothetical protein
MPAKKKVAKRNTLPVTPARRADGVRARLAQSGIDKQDVPGAVSWARKVTSKA